MSKDAGEENAKKDLLDLIVKVVFNEEGKYLRSKGIKKEDVTYDYTLKNDLGIDSLDYINIITGIEKSIARKYKIDNFAFPDTELAEIQSEREIKVGDIVNALYSKINEYKSK